MDSAGEGGLLDQEMSSPSQPSDQQQLQFLQNLQRLFEEGDFSATYKYALLLSISEIAVESHNDSEECLEIPLRRIAEKFAELYWPQTLPYSNGNPKSPSGLLAQNFGQQAAVVRHLLDLRKAGAFTFTDAKHLKQWEPTIRRIERIVREMPVRYLQNLGGSALIFLFDPDTDGGAIRLLPGVAFNLRKFQGFLQQLSRSGWLAHLRRNSQNAPFIGQASDLETFAFGTSRASLIQVAKTLRPIQENRCFYCSGSLVGSAAVDHFIPWSRYPRDTAFNFVLSHAKCNSNKRDLLAAKKHLDRWLERNLRREGEIAEVLEYTGFIANKDISQMIAKWAYSQAAAIGGQGWVSGKTTETISNHYLTSFDECEAL